MSCLFIGNSAAQESSSQLTLQTASEIELIKGLRCLAENACAVAADADIMRCVGLVAGGWWLVAGGWWLVAGGWWLGG
jgi:hypothetical protein